MGAYILLLKTGVEIIPGMVRGNINNFRQPYIIKNNIFDFQILNSHNILYSSKSLNTTLLVSNPLLFIASCYLYFIIIAFPIALFVIGWPLPVVILCDRLPEKGSFLQSGKFLS